MVVAFVAEADAQRIPELPAGMRVRAITADSTRVTGRLLSSPPGEFRLATERGERRLRIDSVVRVERRRLDLQGARAGARTLGTLGFFGGLAGAVACKGLCGSPPTIGGRVLVAAGATAAGIAAGGILGFVFDPSSWHPISHGGTAAAHTHRTRLGVAVAF